MPTYEYECEKCGQIFEHFQSMTEKPLEKCILDGCKGKVKRLLSAGGGVIFKGSGFYETDYKRKSNGSQNSPACPAASSSDGPSCPNAGKCAAAKEE
ncbi:MAG: FmdB family zinc ribbon protein [Candidatus Sumerlaeota bacterium]